MSSIESVHANRYMAGGGGTTETQYPTGVLVGDDVDGTTDYGASETSTTTAGSSFFASGNAGEGRHALIKRLIILEGGSGGANTDIRIRTHSGNKALGPIEAAAGTGAYPRTIDYGEGFIINGGFQIDLRGDTTTPRYQLIWGIV